MHSGAAEASQSRGSLAHGRCISKLHHFPHSRPPPRLCNETRDACLARTLCASVLLRVTQEHTHRTDRERLSSVAAEQGLSYKSRRCVGWRGGRRDTAAEGEERARRYGGGCLSLSHLRRPMASRPHHRFRVGACQYTRAHGPRMRDTSCTTALGFALASGPSVSAASSGSPPASAASRSCASSAEASLPSTATSNPPKISPAT